MAERSTLSRWLPVVVWAGVISLLSTSAFGGEQTGRILLPILRRLLPWATQEQLVLVHHALRKLAHFTEYLVLGLLLVRALDEPGRSFGRIVLWAIVLATLLAIGDELHQALVPGRTAAATDSLVDVAGAIAAQGVALVRRRFRSRSAPSAVGAC